MHTQPLLGCLITLARASWYLYVNTYTTFLFALLVLFAFFNGLLLLFLFFPFHALHFPRSALRL